MIKIIVQARMGSTRLPGKMMLPIIDGKGALELMLERLNVLKTKYSLLVATTQLEEDSVLENICNKLNVRCYRGHKTDVLNRYYNAATSGEKKPDIVVRLTGDCPLHDAEVIEQIINFFLQNNVDYVSNINPPTYPDGLDVEVMSYKALESAHHNSKKNIEREHVTPYIRQNISFKCLNYNNKNDYSNYRWTLDEIEDFKFIKSIYDNLYPKNNNFNMMDVLELLKNQTELLKINQHLIRNESFLKQLKENK